MPPTVPFGHRCDWRRQPAWLLYGVMLWALLPADVVLAQQPAGPSYVLTAWTEKTGLPPGEILSMTQDLEGYLWLGTTGGLVRFDGASFSAGANVGQHQLSNRSIPALLGARDGSLWIGLGDQGGVIRLHDGQVSSYGTGDGLPGGPVAALLQDRRNAIWAATREGLARFREARWEPMFEAGEVYSLFEDRRGQLWVGTAHGVLSVDADRLELRYPQRPYVQSFAEDRNGVLWVTDVQSVVRRLDDDVLPVQAAGVRLPQSGWRLERDRDGRIWVAALGGGLMTLDGSDRALLRRVSYEHLTVGAPRSIFYDRERNLWVGLRPAGLLRVSETSVQSDVALEGLTHDGVRAMAASPDGSVWIGTGHSVNQFRGSERAVYDVAQSRMLYADASGSVWVLTSLGLGRLERGRYTPVRLPSSIRWDRVTSFAIDSGGTFWLCSSNEGLISWRETVLTRFEHVQPVSGRNCSNVYVDRQDRVWIGFSNGDIAVRTGDTFHMYGGDDGLPRGSVLAILEDRTGAVWLTTRNGVTRYRAGRFTSLSQSNGPFHDLVASLVEDQQGFLWIGVDAGSGVVRFDPRTVDSVAADPTREIEYRLFDSSDGMQGELRPLIRAAGVRAADGRLWFATGAGVAVFDPGVLPANTRPGPPRIERVSVDGRTVQPGPQVTLPYGTSTIRIEYTSISLSAASKLRFRYLLEGVDEEWVPAGATRAAVYDNLPWGRYRFRVSATNDGLWTDAGVWEFAIAPPFYRATWFIAVCGFGLTLLLGAAWWLRLGALRRQYALVLEERARLSREIHDTLLQSLAAIGVELETMASQLEGSHDGMRDSLRRLRRQVGHSLREARDSVHNLRHNRFDTRGLTDALQELAANTSASRPARVELTVGGRPRRCAGEVELQLLRIAQEAVANAIRHGRASHIHLALDFEPTTVTLTVSDNGSGFVVEDRGAGRTSGEHLGLLGMTERAERVRGHLTITSSPGKGTIIQVAVPTVEGTR